MIIIDYEVIVKYNGDIIPLEKELGVDIEFLGLGYAIIIAKNQDSIMKLTEYPQIEYVEKPFILETQDSQSFSSTGISDFKKKTGLTGKNTILGVIDSGIDYNLPVFRDSNSKSKILYYWDQSIEGNPPEGFKEGSLYTNEDINKALNNEMYIPVSPTSTHGTHVSGICCDIANEASMIVVRVGRRQNDIFSKSTEFMRGLKFILDKALELKMPVAINISYGSNEGSHKGLSLFEQYIDDMSGVWKNSIVVAAGNNGDKGGHKRIKLSKNETQEVEFVVGEFEKVLNINIWPDFIDDFSVYLVSPSNQKTQPISLTSGVVNNVIGSTKISGYFYPIPPYSMTRRVSFQLSSNSQISPGIWKLVFIPTSIVDGYIDIYLPTSEGLSSETRFLEPSKLLTVTVPGTAKKVITVGSFNSRSDTRSVFSGEGDIENGIYKPDLLAPGEDIVSYLPGGSRGALSGTSMATPHVSGVCSLLMEWGIVQGNDLYLYSQKLKSTILKNARRDPNMTYPNNSYGYGFLDLHDLTLESLSSINKDFLRLGKKKGSKKVKNLSRVNISENIFLQGLIVIHEPSFEKDLEALEGLQVSDKFLNISDNLGILYLSDLEASTVANILNLPSVIRTENLAKMSVLGQITRGISNGVVATEEIGVNFLKNNPNISITGKGTLISVADTGIDYLHPDFIYADGTSKIAYLWDQTKEGKPPEGFYLGTEYTREDINKAIKENNSTLSKDEEGHGTMVSGICAGLGNVNSEYYGVAQDAELIVIKLAKINGFYNSASLLASSQYAYKKSEELNKPLVINVSLGSNHLVGYTSRANTDKTYFTRGLCVAAAVGNEGNTQTHASGRIEFKGDINYIEIELSEEEEELEIDVWISRPDKIDVGIVSPSGEESKFASVSNYNQVKGLFDLENTNYVITYVYPTTYSGQQYTSIMLTRAKKGIWKIVLKGSYIISGFYNIYLPNRVLLKPGTKFREANPDKTVNLPAVQDDLIAVGAYNSITKSLWPGSSRGPNIIGGLKPSIVAPGVNIIAPYPGGTYATLTGTSAAVAHVSGAAAIYFEYTLVDENYLSQAFMQKIRTFMQAGAVRSDDLTYPNNTYGYGVLNIRGMLDVFK